MWSWMSLLLTLRSLPSRERGLKFEDLIIEDKYDQVAPFAGAWIEIHKGANSERLSKVAPFAGAWIEIA